MTTINSFRDLRVWKLSHEVTMEVYQNTTNFPDSEKYGLTNQLRRAAASIPTNIAEGKGRNTTKDYVRFLYNARGSNEELQYLIFLSNELEFLSQSTYEQLLRKSYSVGRMLNKLIGKLKNDIK